MQTMLRHASQLMQALDTPISLKIHTLIKYGEWDQLASAAIDPRLYLEGDEKRYLRDAQAVNFIRKLPDLPTTHDRKAVARERFVASELENAKTNLRFRQTVEGFYDPSLWSAPLVDFHEKVQNRVAGWLGGLPRDPKLRFGPGANFELKWPLVTVADKIAGNPSATSALRPYYALFERTAWFRAHAVVGRPIQPNIIRGGRYTCVPKDGETERGITIEPGMNVALQLAIGKEMRLRLKAVNIDLDENQDTHRKLAQVASCDGSLTTLDLKDASNRNALYMVRSVLAKSSWLPLLDDARSPSVRMGRTWRRLEMYSAMGNGFTFELETLIFLALTCQAIEAEGGTPIPGVNVFVYGDDIIFPQQYTNVVISALRFYGHLPNAKKTFSTGSFRESCGGDFMNGHSVRPHFVKELPIEPQDYISLANGLSRLMEQLDAATARAVRRVRYDVLGQLPTDIRRLRGPKSLGDAVIWEDDASKWQIRSAPSVSRQWIRSYQPIQGFIPWVHWRRDVVLASALYGVDSRGPASPAVHGYRKAWIALLEV